LTAVKKSSAGTTKAAPAKKAATRSTSVAKSGARAAVKAAPAKKTAVGKAVSGKKAATKAAPAKKSATPTRAATKAAPAKNSATKAAPAKKVDGKAPATKAPAKKAAAAAQTATTTKVAAAKKAAPEAPKRPTVGPYAKEQKFLDAQRVLLLEERAIYAGQAVDLRAEADSLALEREPGDVQFDEESGEGGTVTVDRERNLALSAQATAAVEEIDDALRKLDRKTYGGCERCFRPIPKARLQALPFARLCVACKSGGLSRR
jgi:RNA polymerase-binding transcription factor DksA